MCEQRKFAIQAIAEVREFTPPSRHGDREICMPSPIPRRCHEKAAENRGSQTGVVHMVSTNMVSVTALT